MKNQDGFLIATFLVALGALSSNPNFEQALTAITTGPWPSKVSAACGIAGVFGSILIARFTPTRP